MFVHAPQDIIGRLQRQFLYQGGRAQKLMRAMTLITMCIGPSLSSDRGILIGVKNADGEEARGLHENAREEARELHEKHEQSTCEFLELQRPDQSHESIQMSRAVKAKRA